MTALRLLIADDHPMFRRGLAAVLSTEPGLEVVGQAQDADMAVALAEALRPDVVLMDLHMPGGGIEATRRVARSCPETQILIVTMFQDDASVFTALRAGARGYVLKDADETELLRAVRAVGSREAIFSPVIAAQVLAYFSRPAAHNWEAFPELTAREREILHLIAQGRSNAEIARQLALSGKTVANYVSNIFGKLQVADRTEAMLRARTAGLGER